MLAISARPPSSQCPPPTTIAHAAHPLGRAGWRRLRHGADAEHSVVGVRGAATSRSATSAALSISSVAASSAADHVRGKLHAARASAVERRLRVSFAMFQAGWALSVISLTPLVMLRVDLPIEAAVFASTLLLSNTIFLGIITDGRGGIWLAETARDKKNRLHAMKFRHVPATGRLCRCCTVVRHGDGP